VIAYKKDIDDQRESPSLKIIDLLMKRGIKVEYNDPYVPESRGHGEYPGMDLKSVPLTEKRLGGGGCGHHLDGSLLLRLPLDRPQRQAGYRQRECRQEAAQERRKSVINYLA
jgi:hypothetical protein